jgi:hypothetical protein
MSPRSIIARAGPLLALVALAGDSAAAGQRRFALVAGNDSGGADTRPLRYAAEDARRVHAVLTQLGGVTPGDAGLLVNQSASELWRVLAGLEARIADARARGDRALLIFYFSGHAKNGELRLGESRIPLRDLKAHLASGIADIRVGIIDSCRSGIVNRTKGARHAPAFEIEAAGSEETRGLVLLTSASADEDAQESDQIGGSYFSHYLVSGLRGDADRSRDRRVTLSEAYAYAYARTVADTAESAAGAQHPTFSYDLKGNADLVLTDIASRREGIYVPAHAPAGIYYIVDGNGFIAAEVQKDADGDRQIALPPGRYHVRRRLADRLRIGEIQIAPGQIATVEEASLHDTPFSDDPVKGVPREPGLGLSLRLGGLMQSFFDGPTRDSLFPPSAMLGIDFEIRDFLRRGWIWGFDVGGGWARGSLDRYGSQLPFRFGEFTLGTTVAPEWRFGGSGLSASAGLRLAFVLMSRRFDVLADGTQIPDQFFATFTPGLAAGLRYHLTDSFVLSGRGRVHYLLYNVDENRSLGYWELSAGVAYDF